MPSASTPYLSCTRKAARQRLEPSVIIVSVLEDGPLPKRLLEAGASGYVGKGGNAHEMLRAVREVALWRRYLGNTIAQNLALSILEGSGSLRCVVFARAGGRLAADPGPTSGRHRQTLESQRQDINTHKARLFEKVGIQDNIALARLANQYGLTEPARTL